MLLASQQRLAMSARGTSCESERQNLLDRLLDAVKECQVRFGGRTELATDTDSRVSCLLAQWLAIFGHGLRKPKGKIRAIMQVGQVAGITKQQELEPDFYVFIKEHLNKNEVERFAQLHHIKTDAGRGLAWLRSTLNEHTLEKSIHNILGNKALLRLYYESEAFLLDEEKSSMLPMISAGLSSILFALGIDKGEFDSKHVALASTKEVFSNLLPSFPATRPKEEPVAILAETVSNKETKKKKKKKKSAAIVSIDDDVDSSREDLCHNSDRNLPMSDSNCEQKFSKTPVKPGHSRSSSYPGKIQSTLNSSKFHEISREISVSDDSISKLTDNISYSEALNTYYPELDKASYTHSVETIQEKDERQFECILDKKIIDEEIISKESYKLDDVNDVSENRELNTLPMKSANNSVDITGGNGEIMVSSSVFKESGNLLVMGGDNGLVSVSYMRDNLEGQLREDGEEDKNSSKDSVSLSSNSWLDDTDERLEQSEDDLMRVRSESMSVATDAAAAALELCSPKDPMTSITSSGIKAKDVKIEFKEDTMSKGELKQAIVSMMLRKDEIEGQNRVLHQLLDEKLREKEIFQAEVMQLTEESKWKEEQSVAQISALSRENEVLKHQLKKYVGAVQMLRSSMNDGGSVNKEALSGIRQDEILPMLQKQQQNEDIDSPNEAKEYEQKLIQVAEMHGELMEFNDRLQLQYNYWKAQALRLQEELVDLRGPLPHDCQAENMANVFDPLTAASRNRPLINVWIPSVFLKGKGSAGVHHLYQVYVRIKDDEWNVYRRYSQFLELHKKLYKTHKIVETFKFPSKKTFGNRGSKFVEERRKSLQEYVRRVVNLLISTTPELTSDTSKTSLINVISFFGDPYPPRMASKKSSTKRRNKQPYDGL